ncbi:hypothetical protein GGE16_006259 [Rhizobium leguminosarum]|uniref:Uncharacterized protein n=1 Tax=Rhizobium leguminosarum TaxID=384 RepID=A0AAE2T071_RHILE|nr:MULTISPECIES: hypothetical protein [Rhizobium]MBB4294160.1 hypothetical protein [Rhizobium leguminosarum]MBB4300656.1 hypothetical protein [Rhizobium leguminosarum]MBB4312032.1 hypothetical protein [Rhizobium leguminosarum]MBB4420998.1 hypothetical protein [Rhizobium leguminosarum]MBB4436186.1 hypothetical protein [Rhizobium esperanzae]
MNATIAVAHPPLADVLYLQLRFGQLALPTIMGWATSKWRSTSRLRLCAGRERQSPLSLMGQTVGRCRDSEGHRRSLDDAWRRQLAGDETKGARLRDWVYLELADLDADDFDAAFPGIWTREAAYPPKDRRCDLAFFSTWRLVDTSMEKLVTVEGHRWAIEDNFETAKNEAALRSRH